MLYENTLLKDCRRFYKVFIEVGFFFLVKIRKRYTKHLRFELILYLISSNEFKSLCYSSPHSACQRMLKLICSDFFTFLIFCENICLTFNLRENGRQGQRVLVEVNGKISQRNTHKYLTN